MKFTKSSSVFNLSILCLAMIVCLASCKNDAVDPTPNMNESVASDTWISELKSVIDDTDYYYTLSLDENDENIALSNHRILKVDADGQIVSNIDFTPAAEDRVFTKIYKGKIYRFVDPNDFSNFDPNKNISLEIYDTSGALLSTHSLDADGLLYDVQIEDTEHIGMMVFNRDNFTMKVQKFHIDNGMLAEHVLSTSSSQPNRLFISEQGNYYCYHSGAAKTYFHFDNDLNLNVQNNFSSFFIRGIQPVPGRGMFAMGSKSGASMDFSFSNVSFAYIGEDGELNNRVDLEIDDSKRVYDFQINDEVLCIILGEPETNLGFQLRFFDLDFTPLSTLDIPGFGPTSNVILNDNGSFTFLYGFLPDPASTNFAESVPRIFKLDKTYTIPTTIIEQ